MITRTLARWGTLAMLCTALMGVAFAQDASDEVAQLKAQLARQQKQIDDLARKLDQLNNTNDKTSTTAETTKPDNRPLVASTTPIFPSMPASAAPIVLPSSSQNAAIVEPSPLQLRIGDAFITPIGFMDFTSVFRNHDVGSGIGTNFGGIPYGNIYQNNLSEERLSMQNSRIGFRIDALVKGAHVIGYMETDFLGNNGGNVAVSSNSNTLRSRVYWVDITKNKFEVLAGQTWSLITPGRTGISPLPGNLFYGQNIDTNYQAGLVWGRIPEIRFVYHPSDKMALALAFDQQEQYVGGSSGGGTATFPAALAATYPGGELNNQTNTLATPNVFPDTIVKLAVDPDKRFHAEIGGVIREFKVWNPNTSTHYSVAGGGGFLNLNFQLFPGFRLITNNYFSDGGGRYIFGQAPDLVARADGSLSLIHASSTVSGFEYTNKNTLFYAYYGGIYVGRNVTIDTNGALVGYGYKGSANGQNRAIQEATFGMAQTFWKDPKYGALTFSGQYSYLTRNPWAVAAGQPTNADLSMFFLNLRYTLPGTAPNLH